MTHLERVSIIHDVVINNENYLDTTRKYSVSTTLVTMLMYKLKKNKNFLKEIQAKTEAKEDKIEKIMKTA